MAVFFVFLLVVLIARANIFYRIGWKHAVRYVQSAPHREEQKRRKTEEQIRNRIMRVANNQPGYWASIAKPLVGSESAAYVYCLTHADPEVRISVSLERVGHIRLAHGQNLHRERRFGSTDKEVDEAIGYLLSVLGSKQVA